MDEIDYELGRDREEHRDYLEGQASDQLEREAFERERFVATHRHLSPARKFDIQVLAVDDGVVHVRSTTGRIHNISVELFNTQYEAVDRHSSQYDGFQIIRDGPIWTVETEWLTENQMVRLAHAILSEVEIAQTTPCPICNDQFVVAVAGPDENGQFDTEDCPCQT